MPDKKQPEIVITAVEPNSIAEEIGLEPGDRLITINGRVPRDVLDYQSLADGEDIKVVIERDGESTCVEIEKDEGDSLGLSFGDVVFDGVRQCKNRCVFCFIHQNPKGMRKSIWVRDDDYRLSFLEGHFITLTNLSDEEWTRITEERMSPMRVSVHATDPDVRRRMLKHPDAGNVMNHLQRLFDAGISVHTQVVLCPGWNDAEVLERTVHELAEHHPNVISIAVVPVGLSGYRKNLPDLSPVSPELARETIRVVGKWQRALKYRLGTRFVFLADEFWLKAGMAFPKYTEYEDFPALEDGVGLCRLWDHQWRLARRKLPESLAAPRRVTVITGELAEPVLRKTIDGLNLVEGLEVELLPVRNEFFGGGITVTGLLTGSDIIRAVKNTDIGDALILPDVMTRQGVFLDDVTLDEVEKAAGAPVLSVDTSPAGLINAAMGA